MPPKGQGVSKANLADVGKNIPRPPADNIDTGAGVCILCGMVARRRWEVLFRHAALFAGLWLAQPMMMTALAANAPATSPASAAGGRAVVQLGDSEAVIEQKLGQARAVLGTDTQTFLDYPEGRIILVNDHATVVPAALLAPAAPTSAPATAAPAPTAAPRPVSAPAPATAATPPAPATPAPTTAPAAASASAAKPAASAASATAKPVVSASNPAPAPDDSGFQIPIWAYVLVVLLIAFIGLKFWDSKAKKKAAAAPAVRTGTPGAPAATASEIPQMPLGEPPPAAAPSEPKKIPLPLKKAAAPPPETPKPVVETPPPAPAPETLRPKLSIPTRATTPPTPPAPAADSPPSEPSAPPPADTPAPTAIPRLSLKLNRPNPPAPPASPPGNGG